VLAHHNNCLLLDEPTNNLDIVAKETLLEALERFPGTVVLVSHDRYILNQLVSEVIEVGHGHAIRYLGNYDEYLEKKAAEQARADGAAAYDFAASAREVTRNGAGAGEAPTEAANAARSNGGGSEAKVRQAAREAQRGRAKHFKQRAALEAEIEKRESERAALSVEMNDPNFYLARQDADQMISRYERLGREIDGLYEQLVTFEDAGE
jgi:ATP-binding cassette subfamily F protein 3